MLARMDRISERVAEAMNLDATNEIHIQQKCGLRSTWMQTHSEIMNNFAPKGLVVTHISSIDIQATMD